jgi:hypothetical protein
MPVRRHQEVKAAFNALREAPEAEKALLTENWQGLVKEKEALLPTLLALQRELSAKLPGMHVPMPVALIIDLSSRVYILCTNSCRASCKRPLYVHALSVAPHRRYVSVLSVIACSEGFSLCCIMHLSSAQVPRAPLPLPAPQVCFASAFQHLWYTFS